MNGSKMLVGFHLSRRFATTLTPLRISQLLSANEVSLEGSAGVNDVAGPAHRRQHIPSQIRSIECNQLAANNPIEDRLRVSSLRLPGSREPTLILGVFDGHGGGTTANLISRRLFNYIALALHPAPGNLEISTASTDKMDLDTAAAESLSSIVDLHNSPQPSSNSHLQSIELDLLNSYRSEMVAQRQEQQQQHSSSNEEPDIVAKLCESFRRCDDDLSQEIQTHLMRPTSLDQHALRHYLSASVSGCCAIVMVIHEGTAYLASSGDCRAVLGVYNRHHQGAPPAALSASARPEGHESAARGRADTMSTTSQQQQQFEPPRQSELSALELNDEHNSDNINEIRRLAAAHPRSEQNTMIKHDRLLGHLMPFRAFGDFTYKWPAEVIRACGITRAFGPGVIPAGYSSPPYLIVDPDVRVLPLEEAQNDHDAAGQSRYLVMASDGLWELFESSRDVIEAIVDHSLNGRLEAYQEDYDSNCATYVMRTALRSGPHQDIGMDRERMRRLNHLRLESTLTLPKSVVRNYRDDISLILMKLA